MARPWLSDPLRERLLTFLAIAVAAYIGAYIRIGISFYKIWKIETSYVSVFYLVIGNHV